MMGYLSAAGEFAVFAGLLVLVYAGGKKVSEDTEWALILAVIVLFAAVAGAVFHHDERTDRLASPIGGAKASAYTSEPMEAAP